MTRWVLGVLALLLVMSQHGAAQVPPNAKWLTLETPHFRVTFTPELETYARRTAARAEEAYAELARLLRPPRGKVDIVVSDNVDVSNGFATSFPSNRIVLYANPPITSSALRFVDDPADMIVTHELMHIFQLDRTAGLWSVAQKLFGRSPYLFPNAYQPSWLLEGMAVYFETKLTGSGRLAGSEHRMIARSAAMTHALPRIDQLSLANPRFPYAYSTYAYGSLFAEHLANTYGDSAIRRYIESSSRNLIPMWLDLPARRAFGRSLTREYREWTRSLLDSAPPSEPAMPGWRDLTVDGAYASFPRWLDDSTLIYVGTPGRESYGLYQLRVREQRAERRRLARRHTESPNSLLPDGSLVYSQLEYSGPYHLRSDLYMDRPRGGTVRLTRNARLSMPDARADGRIVAMQTLAGGTRLALVTRDGSVITPITSGGIDEQWAEPRWSPLGDRIAAIRWTTGGRAELLLLDTAGTVQSTLFRARAVVATPSWSSDGHHVYFSSDHSGIANLYRVAVADSIGGVERMSTARTGLFEPQPSPGDSTLAAVIFRADGYHVGIAPLRETAGVAVTDSMLPDSGIATSGSAHSAPARPYSASRSLLPRYWVPFFESALDDNSLRVGAYTSGEDLVGRHAYRAFFFVPSDNSGLTGSVYYRNARLGQPVIELAGAQDWENFRCVLNSQDQCIGILRRRIRDAALGFAFQRPRARTFSYFSVGGGVEARDYAPESPSLRNDVLPVYRQVHYYPRVVVSTGWSNTQFPPLAISPEDGVSLAGTARYRWRTGDTLVGTHSLVGSASAFKSLDLPGFGHHVAAVRLAAGQLDNRATGYLEVGGVSGGTLDVLPGYTLGEGRRTFGVRGFPTASVLGMRALAGSIEYRAPFLLPGRGLGTLPLFLDRTSVTLFGDAGTAWCPALYTARAAPSTSICTPGDYAYGRTTAIGQAPLIFRNPPLLTSVGAELNVNAAILSWDSPFRYRLGVAMPVAGKSTVPAATATVYFTVGSSF